MKLPIYALCLFFLIGIALNSQADQAGLKQIKEISLVYEEKSNPPFYYDQKHLNPTKPGITLEVLNLLEQKLNIKFSYRRTPWARGLVLVKNGRVDGIFHASYEEERLKIGVYPMRKGKPDSSRKLMNQSYFLYKRKQSPVSWDGQRLQGLKGPIGAVVEYAIVRDLQAMNVEVEEVTSQWSNLRKLALGRVAGVAGLESMNDHLIKSNPEKLKDIVKVYPPLTSKPYYLMFSHKFIRQNSELAETIWDGIRDIRETGKYDEIAKKYIDVN